MKSIRQPSAPNAVTRRVLAGGLSVWCALGATGWTEPFFARPAPRLEPLPRPPFAISAGRDTSGKTWNEWGTIAANFNAAREDFAKSLRLQNWRLDKTIPVGNLKMKSELTVWNKGQRQILLLITATGAGQCAFAWGEAREPLGAEALIH